MKAISRDRRPGWLDTIRDAADLALLGMLATTGSLGVVTTGAAVATSSAALHHWREHGRWPTAGEIVRRYVRALLPGVPVSLLALGVAGLLALNISAFDRGIVPGGTALIWVTLLLASVLAGYASLIVVEVGRADASGWRAAAREATRAAVTRPAVIAALAGVTALGAVLVVTAIPVAAPILLGYLLFAQHTVARRLLA